MTKALNPTQNLVQDNKSGVWNARWFVTADGRKKEKRKSLGTKNIAEARKLIKPFMARIDAARYGGMAAPEGDDRRSKVTWKEVCDAYRGDKETYPTNPNTAKRYEADLSRIGTFLKESNVRPEEIDEDTVKLFVTDCRDDGLSTSSIKNALTAWNRAMQAAAYHGTIPASAAAPVRFYNRKRLRKDEAPSRPPMGDDFD